MPTVSFAPYAVPQFLDNEGKPIRGGTLETYLAGTSTPAATYADSAGAVPNPTTIQLDSAGRPANGGALVDIRLDVTRAYKFVLKDREGAIVRTVDNISAAVKGGALSDGAVDARTITDNPDEQDAVARKIGALTAVAETPIELLALTRQFPADSTIRTANGFIYEVAPADATDAHLTTAGGVKLYVLSNPIPDAAAFGDNIRGAIENKTGVSHILTVPIGDHPLDAGASITAYSLISGFGDMSNIVVPPGQKGIAYTSHSGVFDDHPHNVIRDLRITGDGTFVGLPGGQNGTSTGVSFAEVNYIGSLGNVEGTVLQLHNVGRHVKASFGHSGRRNYYRANKIGLLLEQVTSFTEYDIYARYNSTAAVRISGGQNVTFRGGAIEGNPGKAIEYIDDGTSTWGQVNIDDVYFEANGSQADGIWSIDVPFDARTMLNIRSGSYWTNAYAGRTSGPYRLGPSVSIEGATMNAPFYAKEVVGFRNVRGPGVGIWNTMASEASSRVFGLVEPALFHEFKPAAYEYNFGSSPSSGLIIGTKVMGRGGGTLPNMPNIANLTYPYGFVATSGATSSENAALDYGEGSWWRVRFGNSAGNFSSNYATLAYFPDTTKQFRVFCALVQPEADCEIGFMQSVGGQATSGYFKLLAGKTYRLVFCAMIGMTGGSYLRMFPLTASAPAVNVLPIWQGQTSSYLEQLKAIELLVEGRL